MDRHIAYVSRANCGAWRSLCQARLCHDVSRIVLWCLQSSSKLPDVLASNMHVFGVYTFIFPISSTPFLLAQDLNNENAEDRSLFPAAHGLSSQFFFLYSCFYATWNGSQLYTLLVSSCRTMWLRNQCQLRMDLCVLSLMSWELETCVRCTVELPNFCTIIAM
jgi:hypothetical protein